MRGSARESFTAAALTLGLLALLAAGQAQAHARLVTADPAPNTTVAAPTRIHLEFSEEIAQKLSSFKVTDTGGNPVVVRAMPVKNAKALEAMPIAILTSGLYTVSWIAVSTDDGHKTTGSYSFTIK